jgi:hypothetical protein
MASSYGFLGRRGPITGAADQTGRNPGNWTVAFSPAVLNFTLPEILIYKIQVSGVPGSSFDVWIDNDQWDVNIYGSQNSWNDDAGDALVVRTGQSLYLMYSDPITDNSPPMATCFLRYDKSLTALTGLNLPGS